MLVRFHPKLIGDMRGSLYTLVCLFLVHTISVLHTQTNMSNQQN